MATGTLYRKTVWFFRGLSEYTRLVRVACMCRDSSVERCCGHFDKQCTSPAEMDLQKLLRRSTRVIWRKISPSELGRQCHCV